MRDSYSTVLSYSTDDSTYTALTKLKSIDPPPMSRAAGNATHLESANQYREKAPGWRETQPMKFTAYMVDGAVNTLVGFLNNETTYYWKIQYPAYSGQTTGAVLKGQGFVTNLTLGKIDEGSDDPIDFEVEITPTGKWTFTAGS